MHRRLVYSSLDSHTIDKDIPQQNNRKKVNKSKMKRIEAFNAKMQSAARVYLNQLKHIPKHEINDILSGQGSEYPSIERKLYDQIKRRKHPKVQKLQLDQQGKLSYRYHADNTIETNQQQMRIGKSKKKKFMKVKYNSMAESFRARYGVKDNTVQTTLSDLQNQIKRHRRIHVKSTCLPKYIPTAQGLQFEDKQQNYNTKINLEIKVPITYRYKIDSKRNGKVSQTARQPSISPTNIRSEIENQATILTNLTRNKSTARNINGFVVNQKDELISNLLLAQGWKAFSQKSEHFILKWTYNQSSKDFQLLQNAFKNKRKIYFNHISNNKLTNKQDFCCLTRKLKGNYVEQFIPQTYIISSEKAKFLDSYQNRAIYGCLRKHYYYLKQKMVFMSDSCSFFKDRLQLVQQFSQFLIKINDETAHSALLNSHDNDIVVNIPALYNLLILSCNIFLKQSQKQSPTFAIKFTKVINDANIINSIITLSRNDLPLQQYNSINSSSKGKSSQTKNSNNKQMSIVDGYLKMVKTFGTPSNKLISAVQFLYQYFNQQLKCKFYGGPRNLWIIKPCSGSKGSGIELIDRPERVNQIAQSNSYRIVQKYIQNIWTINSSHAEVLKGEYKNLVNKKFDIRQWVLLVPPKSYIFSSFYLRVCSKQYSFNTLNDPCSHLSNFSINRSQYTNMEQSVLSEQQFGNILQKLNMKHKLTHMKSKMHKQIKLITDQAISQCQTIAGTFQIVGFDILIDQQFNPWIIQCNMSPACSLRTNWLKQMKQAMTAGALQIVLPQNLYSHEEQSASKYKWIQLTNTDR